MKTYSGSGLVNIISDLKKQAMEQTGLSAVYERDFVDDIRKYCFGGKSPFVFVICGLKDTGKTFGLLQAVENPDDTIYILAQQDEDLTGRDYIKFLKTVKEKNIIIDEYSWIKDNHDLSYYLWTLVENGKRVAITGAQTLALDYLEDGVLVHRTDRINVNLFSYEEYCRVYQKDYSKANCVEFLQIGGLFNNCSRDMENYLQEALISDLSGFINLHAEDAKTIVYEIIYSAVCEKRKVSEIRPVMLENVTGILEKANFVVRTYNFCNEDEFRLHLVNPAFAYLAGEKSLCKAFEAYLTAYMTTCVRKTDYIRYIDIGGQGSVLVIVNPNDGAAYLFGTELQESSLTSDNLEKTLGCLSVGGRYVAGYNPTEKCGVINGKKVIFTGLDSETLQCYRQFDENYSRLQGGVGNGDDEQQIKPKKKQVGYNDD